MSRVLPAYKFARRQGPDTHVMCYRIFAGEPNPNPLGTDRQSAQIGQVMTGYSTICVRVEFRTQMTITPTCKNLGSAGDPSTFSCSGTGSSSQQSASANIWAKSDHFASAENLENAGIIRKNISNPDYEANVTTSDESSEAMRIFAASPPDNFFHNKRFSDHYSSNESLGIQKFRSSK